MRRRYLDVVLVAAAAGAGALYCCAGPQPGEIETCATVDRLPRLFPDYAGTVIPPNIAPLNFTVQEPGTEYRVRISSARGDPIEIAGKDSRILIPMRRWKALLRSNAGQALSVDVYARGRDGSWRRFQTITNTIADARIDAYLVYRLIRATHKHTHRYGMGIYQRCLENFDEKSIFQSRSFGGGCVNCHTFLRNAPETMTLQVRCAYGAPMLIVREGRVTHVDTRSEFRPKSGGYTSWHPNGRLVVFSINDLSQLHHSVGEKRDVFDAEADLAVYDLESNTLRTVLAIAEPDRLETWPSWSSDGRFLYFCSAPRLPVNRIKEIRFDLVRIPYNAADGTWGEPETLAAAGETGLSAAAPRESPDGRWLLFSLAEYGNFPIYQPSCDLYLMDLQTRKYRRLAINSDRCDSWHSWSSDGRWIAFSSKRRDGLFTKVYFSYFDPDGKAHKPFLMPQQDPEFYDSCIRVYNVPELVTGPVRVSGRDLGKAVCSPAEVVKVRYDSALAPRVPEPVAPGLEKPAPWQTGGQ